METFPAVPSQILQRAVAHPDRTAVVAGDQSLTFGELLRRSLGLAGRLHAAGVTKEDIVACSVPRGLDTVTAVLGTWLAGAAYLALDPEASSDRVDYMLRDSGAKVTLIEENLREVDCPEGAEHVEVSAGDLAYVVYTSGSTGRPKAVLVEHGSLTNMAAAHEHVLHPRDAPECRRVALNAVTTADTFFSDLVNLAAGRTLDIVDEQTRRDPERLASFLAERKIDVLDATPTQLRALLLGVGATALAELRLVVVGNEPSDAGLWRNLRELPGVRAHNFYGPTECTVDVTSAALADNADPVIGRALPGCDVRLVDAQLRPVAVGEVGEICVSGVCLARGYLHAEPSDAARFIELPTGRAYMTGDRARLLPSGALEFIGRTDDQVKISGHRVELGEVEYALRSRPDVLDTAVAASDGSLAGWVVLADGVSPQSVSQALRASLPAHLVPALTAVSHIPVGPTGKADLDALRRETATVNEAHDDLEAIWCKVLSADAVAASDDFFDCGGDSLKATQLIVAVREAFVPGLPIRTIFDNPQFGAFAGAVAGRADR